MYQSSKKNRKAADYISAMEAEPISKNRVSSRKTTGVGRSFMKRFAGAIFGLCLALNLAAQTSGTTGDCTWALTGSGSNLTLTISGNGAMENYTYYGNVPWSSQNTNIKTVTIADGVTSIGSEAFYGCTGLTSATIPNSVTYIGDVAFSSSTPFYNNQPNGVVYFGKVLYAYKGTMPSNTSLTIQSGTTSISAFAFDGCTSLTSVSIPNSVTYIGKYAFRDTPFFNNQPNGVVYFGKVLYAYKGTMPSNTSLTIQSGTTAISALAFFYNCTGLTSVTIPNSVTSIGSNAFGHCTGLTSVTIPNSVTYIGDAAFDHCSGLTGSLTIPNSVTSIGSNAFGYCTGLTSVTISNSVTYIGVAAFQYTGLTGSLTIPNSVTYIGNAAFQGTDLTSVTISDSVTIIGDFTFAGCTSLTLVTIPNSVTSIGSDAFTGCTSLTSVTIPNSVASIGGAAFDRCTGLRDVTVNWNTPLSISSYMFNRVRTANINLHVPENSCALYAAAPVWQDFKFSCGSQTIDFPAISEKIYGDETITLPEKTNANLTISYQSSNTAVATVAGNTLTIRGAGTADITASQSGNTHIMAATPVTQTLTVNKAPLTVTADNKTRRVGEPNPALTYTISGFKNSETQSVIDVPPTLTTTATQASSAGSYPITASGASDNNYSFTYQDGTLTITAAQTYTVSLSASPTAGGTVSGGGTYNDGASCTVTATANSGYTFTNWTESGSQVSTSANYSFAVTANKTLTANFTANAVAPPTVTTLAATNITQTTATLNKSVSAGSETITSQGFKYKKTSASSWTTSTTGSLTGLTAGTQYQFYVYATTASGTINGTTLTFTTTSSGGEDVITWEIGSPNAADVIATLNLADSTLTISGTGAMQDYLYNGAPWSWGNWGNYPIKTVVITDGVTTIGKDAFAQYSALISVTIGNSVTSIGKEAFYRCSGLTSVTIGNSVTTIGDYAFADCRGLTSVTIPESVTSIGEGAFVNLTTVNFNATSCEVMGHFYPVFGSSLTTLNIGSNVTKIPDNAFYKCTGLTEVTIPNSVTAIGWHAFQGCIGLISVTIPESVTAIGLYAFKDCNNLTTVNFNATNCTMHYNVNSPVFSGCTSFTTLNIGNNVTTIPDFAFEGCTGLTDVTVNWATPLSISSYVFYGDTLSNVNLHIPENTCAWYIAAPVWQNFNIACSQTIFFEIGYPNAADVIATLNLADSTLTIRGIGAMQDFTQGFTTIPSSQPWYSYRSRIKTVVIEDGVTNIGDYAFTNCTGWTSVTIPNSVTTIGMYAFYYCRDLTSVTIGDSITTIGMYAFNGCTGLTSLTIGNSVTTIGEDAFANCYNLTEVTIGNSVTTIGENAFAVCYSLTEVTIGNSVTTIGSYAFYGCRGLTEVTIPNSVTSIGSYAFYGCRGLTDITVNWATPLSISGSGVFQNVTLSNVNLHVPENSCALYAAASVWTNFNFNCSQTIDFPAIPAKTYGDAVITLSEKTNANLTISYQSSNTAVATVSGNRLTVKGAGTADITATQNSSTTHFTAATPVTQTLIVNKAPLTVTAENKSREYGAANPNLTYSISGFKNSETQSVIDVLPTVATTATQTSNAGNYAITASGASDNNYDFGYTNGTLTIEKAAQTITFISGISIKKYGDASFTIAQTSSGLTPTIVSSDPSKLVVANNTAYIVGTGTFALTASQSGNINYLPAPDAVTTVTVSKAPLIITANDAVRNFGEANPPFTLSYSGFTNGENEGVLDLLPTAACPANETSPAGDFVITLSGGHDNNYIYTLVSGKLTVEDVVTEIKNVTAEQLQIYPNPVREELFIKSETPIQKVEIYTLSGTLLLSENNFNGKISVSALPKGVYLLKVYSGSDVAVSKIVKE
ncbi:hypothetical protein AGMMS49525_03180 [Bacteroidia bacterium]|nr:hypothetical protein AGMMS49525_03180 [Bacteroidia bacterium]